MRIRQRWDKRDDQEKEDDGGDEMRDRGGERGRVFDGV